MVLVEEGNCIALHKLCQIGMFTYIEEMTSVIVDSRARVYQEIEWPADILLPVVTPAEGRNTHLESKELFDRIGVLPVLIIKSVELVRLVIQGDLVAREFCIEGDELCTSY